MPLNPYFQNYDYAPTQALLESLIIESIKIYGVDIYYIPRTVGALDELMGEDNDSKFEKAAALEVYVKDYQGFRGDGSFLAKFGLELRQQMTFNFSVRRFSEIRTPAMMSEEGWDIQLESAPDWTPDASSTYTLEDGNSGGFFIANENPKIGDLIYFPLVKKWYEIKNVRTDEVNFYQLGKLQMYEIDTELFEYSHETFSTGIADIDLINKFDVNALADVYLNEDGTTMLMENGEPYILEEHDIGEFDDGADNTTIKLEADKVVDWSQVSPLTRRDSDGHW